MTGPARPATEGDAEKERGVICHSIRAMSRIALKQLQHVAANSDYDDDEHNKDDDDGDVVVVVVA